MSVLEKEFFLEQFKRVHERFDEVDSRLDDHDKKFERAFDELGAIRTAVNQQHYATGSLFTMV